MTYIPYSTFLFQIFDAILDRIRLDTQTGNYGFKAFEIHGDGRFPEVAGMPLVRLIPDPDTIDRLETNTRNHFINITIRIYDHKIDGGDQDYRDHVTIAGAVYDIFSRRDPGDPTLGGLVEELQVRTVSTKRVPGEQGVTFVSVMPMSILVVKDDE